MYPLYEEGTKSIGCNNKRGIFQITRAVRPKTAVIVGDWVISSVWSLAPLTEFEIHPQTTVIKFALLTFAKKKYNEHYYRINTDQQRHDAF